MSQVNGITNAPDIVRHAPIVRDDKGAPVVENGATKRGPVQEYKLAPTDALGVIGRWETYLEDQAWAALERQRKRCSPPEFERKEQGLLAAIAAGNYTLYEQVSYDAMRTPFKPAYRHLVYLRLLPYHPDATEALASEIADEEVAVILRKFRELHGTTDPNSKAPDEGANGSSSRLSAPCSSKQESSPTSGTA